MLALNSPYRGPTSQVITLEAEKQEDVVAATEALEKLLPDEFVVKVVADDDLKDV